MTMHTYPLNCIYMKIMNKYIHIFIWSLSQICQLSPQPVLRNFTNDDDDQNNEAIYHYSDVIMDAVASRITSLNIVYSPVYSGAHQRKHQTSALLAFVMGIHRWSVNSPHKGPVTRKLFPFHDVIMWNFLQILPKKRSQKKELNMTFFTNSSRPTGLLVSSVLTKHISYNTYMVKTGTVHEKS